MTDITVADLDRRFAALKTMKAMKPEHFAHMKVAAKAMLAAGAPIPADYEAQINKLQSTVAAIDWKGTFCADWPAVNTAWGMITSVLAWFVPGTILQPLNIVEGIIQNDFYPRFCTA